MASCRRLLGRRWPGQDRATDLGQTRARVGRGNAGWTGGWAVSRCGPTAGIAPSAAWTAIFYSGLNRSARSRD